MNVNIVLGRQDVGVQMINPYKKQIGGNHYKVWKKQPIEFIRENKLPFIFGVIIKYIMRVATRLHSHDKQIQDLKKVIHYAEIEIKELESEKTVNDIMNNCPNNGKK